LFGLRECRAQRLRASLIAHFGYLICTDAGSALDEPHVGRLSGDEIMTR
jgi:hypothetical protein